MPETEAKVREFVAEAQEESLADYEILPIDRGGDHDDIDRELARYRAELMQFSEHASERWCAVAALGKRRRAELVGASRRWRPPLRQGLELLGQIKFCLCELLHTSSGPQPSCCIVQLGGLMRETAGITARVALVGAGVTGSLAEIGRPNNEQRMLEATVQMERLATKLAHAKTMAAETILEITRLMQRPWYDCNQIACRAAFEARNGAARAHLQTVIAGGRVRTLSALGKATRLQKAATPSFYVHS